MLNNDTITEFKEALKEEYGKDVSLQEASLILTDMVAYFDLLAKINQDMQSGA